MMSQELCHVWLTVRLSFQPSSLPIVSIHQTTGVSPDPLVLGSKGAGLVRMASLGLATPAGFILPIGFQGIWGFEEPSSLLELAADVPEAAVLDTVVPAAIVAAIEELERATGKLLGDEHNPLWVSVRSSGPVSMPGMMDTLLNLGLTWANAWRRWPQLSAQDVAQRYEAQTMRWAQQWGGDKDKEEKHLMPKAESWLRDHPAPSRQDIMAMVWRSIQCVWHSARSARSLAYRAQQSCGQSCRKDGVDTSDIAVIVQQMICGDVSDTSGTGVVFTRCPDTGQPGLFGEWLAQAQGEDIVSGTVTPQPLGALRAGHPQIYQELERAAGLLEEQCGDMQDIEFTVENHRLWLLQTRSAKRSAVASFRYAHDRVITDHWSKAKALSLVSARCVDGLMHAQCMPLAHHVPVGQGLGASPGAAVGVVTLDPRKVNPHCPSILVCHSTTADDVPAMLQAQGVLTLHGGRTSHAAVIMRGAGRPCVTGMPHGRIVAGGLWIGDQWIPEGSTMTLDGSTGHIYGGEVPIQTTPWTPQCVDVLAWADACSPMKIWANADTPADVTKALELGAKGIGLCRSEHMILDPSSLLWWQQWILSTSVQDKNNALQELEKVHYQALRDMLTAAQGHPFVLRLLDPPLHEFLPSGGDDQHRLYQEWLLQGHDSRSWQEHLAGLRPVNPMMGLRGCRLGILYPPLYRMQIRALMTAIKDTSLQGQGSHGQRGWCGILVPLVAHVEEIKAMVAMIRDVALELGRAPLPCGIMIETPRAALMAHQWVQWIDFVSFGTNDLTQLTWGLSRDDGEEITAAYAHLNIHDPFQTFDCEGVGVLLRESCQRLLQAKPSLRLSVCGEHAALPESAAFFHSAGIHTLSCAPFGVPRMRMAAGLLGTDDSR